VTEKFWIEILALAITLILGGVCVVGILGQEKVAERGLGAGMIQLLGVVILGPIVLILGIEKVLNSEAIAAIVGALVGFAIPKPSKGSSKSNPPSSG
jgi:hypothetical protein